MNQGTVIAMLPRPFHLKTSNACCGKSQLGSFPHLLEQLPHLFSLGMLPSLYFYLKPGPEAPQVHFLYPVTYAIYIHRSLLWIKGENTPLETKIFTLACLCFWLHDARILDSFPMMGRHSTANVLVHLSPVTVKHPLAEAPWAVASGSQYSRTLCAPLGLRGLSCFRLSCFPHLSLLLFSRKGTTEGSWDTRCTHSPFLKVAASTYFPDFCLFTGSSLSFPPQGPGSSKICADARKCSWCSKSSDFSEITENVL